MKIIDISPETENQYFCCLEEWSDDIKEAGNRSAILSAPVTVAVAFTHPAEIFVPEIW